MRRRKLFTLAAGVMTLVTTGITGCGSRVPYRGNDWGFRGYVASENLLGCGDRTAARASTFLIPKWTLLKWDNNQVAINFHSHNPPVSLLMKLQVAGGSNSGDWSVSTKTGSLRAWLVRTPGEVLKRTPEREEGSSSTFAAPGWVVDMDFLNDLLAERPRAINELGTRVFPLEGTARIVTDQEHVKSISLDLRTPVAVPLYADYLRYESDALSSLLEQAKAGRDGEADVPAFRHAESQIKADRECLEHWSRGPAILKGEFRGIVEDENSLPI
jgi:hypothetical protein